MNSDVDFTLQVHNINAARNTVQLRVDKSAIARIQKREYAYRSLPNTFRGAMEDVADYVRGTMIPEVFAQEGPGWAKLAPRTLRERAFEGFGTGPILQRTRDLYQELTEKSHPSHIEIIRVGKYARVEIGGSSVKFLENQQGKASAHLPARPMIPGTNGPIPLRHRQKIRDIFANAIKQGLNR